MSVKSTPAAKSAPAKSSPAKSSPKTSMAKSPQKSQARTAKKGEGPKLAPKDGFQKSAELRDGKKTDAANPMKGLKENFGTQAEGAGSKKDEAANPLTSKVGDLEKQLQELKNNFGAAPSPASSSPGSSGSSGGSEESGESQAGQLQMMSEESSSVSENGEGGDPNQELQNLAIALLMSRSQGQSPATQTLQAVLSAKVEQLQSSGVQLKPETSQLVQAALGQAGQAGQAGQPQVGQAFAGFR